MPTFTQKHYVAIAKLIHARRMTVKAVPAVPMDASMSYQHKLDTQVRIEEVNEITNDLVKLFKADNPKFRDLIFVEACCQDMRDAGA
jgi:hypothetical protein